MRKIALVLAALAAVGWAGHAAAGDKGTTVELDGLKSTTPAGWKEGKVDGKFGRLHQFTLPKAEGDKEDAELVIFSFGAGGGGGVKENLRRWQGMMAPPPGKSTDDISKIAEMKVGGAPVTVLDMSGTYLYKFPPAAPNAKVTPKENFRFVGVIFEGEKATYFMRLTGPAKTVEQNKKGFDDWLKGFKASRGG